MSSFLEQQLGQRMRDFEQAGPNRPGLPEFKPHKLSESARRAVLALGRGAETTDEVAKEAAISRDSARNALINLHTRCMVRKDMTKRHEIRWFLVGGSG